MSDPVSDLFPPFQPDPLEPRRRLFKPVPFRVLLPNLITLLALCLGLTAIRLAYEGRLEPAMYAIVIAGVLDGVDGRLARLLKGTSRFGAELDSLSDFVNFGVAPALILYGFILDELKAIGWIAALVFAIAASLRLARFNVMLDDPNRPDWKKDFFVGMPAPAGALAALLPVYLDAAGLTLTGRATAVMVMLYSVTIAVLMVSTVPTYSGKSAGARVPRHWVLPLFVLTVAFVALIVSFPFEVMAVCTLAYLAALPLGVRRYRQLDRAHKAEAARAEPAPGAEALSAPAGG